MNRTAERTHAAAGPSPVDADAARPAPVASAAASSTAASTAAPTPLAEDLLVESRRSLTLRCGKASITLHANGKIVLRGEYILSDAEGVNRIAGGRIELN